MKVSKRLYGDKQRKLYPLGQENNYFLSYKYADNGIPKVTYQIITIGEMEGKLWFCTNNTKDVYKDMLANPEIEISTSSPSYAWIRLNGKAVFENNMAAKEMCMGNPIVKGQYQTADNPIFEVFYLDNAHGVIADFSGNPPYEF